MSNSLDRRLKTLVGPRHCNNSPLLSPTLQIYLNVCIIFPIFLFFQVFFASRYLSHRPKQLCHSAGQCFFLCRLAGPEKCVPAFLEGFIFAFMWLQTTKPTGQWAWNLLFGWFSKSPNLLVLCHLVHRPLTSLLLSLKQSKAWTTTVKATKQSHLVRIST